MPCARWWNFIARPEPLATGFIALSLLGSACDEVTSTPQADTSAPARDAGDDTTPGDAQPAPGPSDAHTLDGPEPGGADSDVPSADAPLTPDPDEACPALPQGPPSVTFTQVPVTFPPPNLRGDLGSAAPPSGSWELSDVTFFTMGTFIDGVDVRFTNGGQTSGKSAFEEGYFAMRLDLDLEVTVEVAGSSGTDRAQSAVSLGGPFTFEGATIRGDFSRCGEGFAVAEARPESLAYEHDGTRLRLAVVFSEEALIAMLPPEQREGARFVVTGPLTVVSRFTQPQRE